MRINKLKINGFGKLRNKEIELQDGINIIYGMNESGKSTIVKFIDAMIFGASKNKNGKNISDFDKYKPWEDYEFSGKIKYTLDNEEEYEVFREFKKKNPVIYNKLNEDITKNFLVNKSKEINFFEQQTNVNENLFLNTGLISQQEIKLNKSDTNNIIQKISNLVSTGNDNVSYQKSIEKINKMQLDTVGNDRTKNKPINVVLENIKDLELERKKLNIFKQNDVNKQKDKEKIIAELDEIQKSKDELLYKKNDDLILNSNEKNWMVILSIFVIISLVILIFTNNIIYKLISFLPIIGILFFYFRMKNIKQKNKNNNLLKIDKEIQKLDEKINDLKVKLHLLEFEKENIDENLEKLARIEEKLSEANLSLNELKSLDGAFKLAKDCLENAYQEMKNNISPKFEKNLCETVAEITDNQYDNVKVSDTEGLLVEIQNGSYMPVDRLSIGAIDEMYISLRLSMLEEVSMEKMPIILDEAFVYFDNERLKNIISYLQDKNYDNQILIFTCSEREINILNELKIEYNLIRLEK